MTYLKTEQLSVGYQHKVLIRDIAISVAKGELVTLIGPNGAGKSTILKSIIRQLLPIRGVVRLDGMDVSTLSPGELARRMSVLMTGPVDAERMTGWDVAAMGRYPYTGRLGILSAEDRGKVEEALALVHAADLAKQAYGTLSDGQRQRILLARAICQEPEILVLDEPTSYLDVHHKLEFLTLLRRLLREKQVAAILSLHELELAQKVSDRIVCVKGEELYAVGTPEEIFRSKIICPLYDIPKEHYIESYGTFELAADSSVQHADGADGGGDGGANSAPRVFLICGGGTGAPVMRRLAREGTPFAVGILPKNDLDYPVACALACKVFAAPAYEPAPEDAFCRAMQTMRQCGRVICTLTSFGSFNQQNEALFRQAEALAPVHV